MSQIKIGDFVTGYGSGYWQLIDIKPKIADEDYNSENVHWKKGDVIGKWVILKKCFTAKMKPRIDFSYEDSAWLKPVSDEIRMEIETYFEENPKYKQKFDQAEVKLKPMILNFWMRLPEDQEKDFRRILANLPDTYTEDTFWNLAKDYKKYISKPPAEYLLHLFAYPWDLDENANLICTACELKKSR